MACVFVYPFLGRPLLSVSPQPGTSWPGKVTGKGSTVPTFKEPQSERTDHSRTTPGLRVGCTSILLVPALVQGTRVLQN